MKPVGLIVACVLLALAGCGGADSTSPGSGSSSASAAGAESTPTTASARPEEQVGHAHLVAKKPEPHIAQPTGPPPKKRVITRDLEEGSGPVAHTGDTITIDFLGDYYESGKQVMSSWERHEPFTFELGGGDGVLGWEHALQGMRVGGRREVIVPAHLTSRYALPSQERSQIYVIDLRAVE